MQSARLNPATTATGVATIEIGTEITGVTIATGIEITGATDTTGIETTTDVTAITAIGARQ